MCWEDWYKSRKLRSKGTVIDSAGVYDFVADANRVRIQVAATIGTAIVWNIKAPDYLNVIVLSSYQNTQLQYADIREIGQIVMSKLSLSNTGDGIIGVVETFIDEVN